MRLKRGQITIYLAIFAIIAVAAVIFVFLGKQESSSKNEIQKELSVDDANVRTFTEKCLEVTGKKAIFYLGFVGGRLSPDPFKEYYSYDANYKVPYFYIEGKNIIPNPYDEDYWERLVDSYINSNFRQCINNYKSFEGITIEQGNAKSNTEFTDKSVIFSVNFPVSVTRDFKKNNLEPDYVYEVDVRLRNILKTVTTIVEQEVKSDRYIHWDYMTDVTAKNYNITAYTEKDNTIVYRIVDLDNKIDDEHYLFQFANKVGRQAK